MAVYVVVICGMIWDHPGMLRLVGLFCALTSLYVAERDRVDIMFGGMLWWATKAKSVWFIISFQSWTVRVARRAGSRWAGAEQWPVSRGHCERVVWSRTFSSNLFQAFFPEKCTFERWPSKPLCTACATFRVFFCFFFLKNPLWMLHDWVEISRCFLQMWANVKCSSSDLKCISWKFTKEQNCQKTKPDQ